MPTIFDSTVVTSGHMPSAHARPQRLANGWIVSMVYDSASTLLRFHVSKDNFLTTPTQLCFRTAIATGGFSMASKGNFIYFVYNGATASNSSFGYFDASTVTNAEVTTVTPLDTGQTALGSTTLLINGNDIYEAHASKNATYSPAFNIRYMKGVIATDNTVMWSFPEQVTKNATITQNHENPSLTVDKNGVPIILFESPLDDANAVVTDSCIGCLMKKPGGITNTIYDSQWTYKTVFKGTNVAYTQTLPSTIFVPQSINGLGSGRIWVTWTGLDSTDTSMSNIRVSFSDDGGVTWSSMQKLTSGNTAKQDLPSITANKFNKIFIVFSNATSGGMNKVSNDGTWSSLTTITGSVNTPSTASTVYDLSLNLSEPLFIYRSSVKVGFYGTWVITTISVTQGAIGQKADRSNFFTYSIFTDATMSTITEKVNGATIGTRTLSINQPATMALTQAQWDAIKFGKYTSSISSSNLPILRSLLQWELKEATATVGNSYSSSASTTTITNKNSYAVSANTEYKVSVGSLYKVKITETDVGGFVTKVQNYRQGDFSFLTTSTTVSVRVSVRLYNDSPAIATSDNVGLLDVLAYPSNTLTIQMGGETFTFTFDKRPVSGADLLSVVKAVQDSSNTLMPAMKSNLGVALRAKGGTVSDADQLDSMVDAVVALPVRKYKAGTFTKSNTAIAITGLGFTPRIISIRLNSGAYFYQGNSDTDMYSYGMKNNTPAQVLITRTVDGFSFLNSAVDFPDGNWTYNAGE